MGNMTIVPTIPVQKAIDRLSKAYTEIGSQHTYDRATIAHALGYANAQSGRFSALMTQLQLYGLLSRNAGTYGFTPLFIRIFTATQASDIQHATAEAALLPRPFRALYDAFKDSRLPIDPARWLLHAFQGDLDEAGATVAVDIFTKNMTDVGLLREGLLIAEPLHEQLHELSKTLGDGARSGDQVPAVMQPAVTVLQKDFGNGRIANVSIPADLTQEERDNLMALIQYL